MVKLQANDSAGGMHMNLRKSGEIKKCSYRLDNGLDLRAGVSNFSYGVITR
jgi:hypothetical protein